MICPNCNGELRTKDTGDLLTAGVYLMAYCPRCFFRLDVVGENDQNAMIILGKHLETLHTETHFNTTAY